jgi:hypothetical protein
MQASCSLFYTGIKLQGRLAVTGISKSRPFLNIGSDSDQQRQAQPGFLQRRRGMASATTFFDFEPKDSALLSSHPASFPHADPQRQKMAKSTHFPSTPAK